jgi:cell envelope opacity-associated protein A
MSNNVSRRLLDRLQAKAGEKVDEGKLRSLASQFTRSDFEDEAKLRQVIRSLAALSGKQLNEEQEDKIVQMFRNQEINLSDVSSLGKLLK